MIPPSTFTSRPTYLSLQPAAGPGRHWSVQQAGNVSDTLLAELAQAFAPVQARLHIVWVGAGEGAPQQAAWLPWLVHPKIAVISAACF